MSTFANEPATIDAAHYAVRRTIAIGAPPEKVWAAITRS